MPRSKFNIKKMKKKSFNGLCISSTDSRCAPALPLTQPPPPPPPQKKKKKFRVFRQSRDLKTGATIHV